MECYGAADPMNCPAPGEAFYGQDAQHQGPALRYEDNGDGTVTDVVTGLTWTKAPGARMTWEEARAQAGTLRLGGQTDWRLPSIQELYSLMDFRGYFGPSAAESIPFIDTSAFELRYAPDTGTLPGQRFFDVQAWSSTPYVGRIMHGDAAVFGVNFADGRIKGYPLLQPGPPGSPPGSPATMFARFVRGNPSYGAVSYSAGAEGTVGDEVHGLIWQRADDGVRRTWAEALAYCEGLTLGGWDDWRLPGAKELQSLVDYSRAPSITGTAAIDPTFSVSSVESYFWSSTTLLDGPPEHRAARAVYLAFGRALGWMEEPPGSGNWTLLDVHGAGAQRADPKEGDPSDYPHGFGPQGDDVRILNYVRCVRS
ncbi:MAG TPA: DUF1566 domain-containing protein [Myxococcales bacterium]|nr:DUF1566 domain-containing protein [Myxococcales bacterium]